MEESQEDERQIAEASEATPHIHPSPRATTSPQMDTEFDDAALEEGHE